jgi:uncharacterized protein YndB with AHSA1/START domain
MAAGSRTIDARSTADREILITRVFDAPRELVFDAFLDPEHIGDWWGPAGFRITTQSMDVRPGGEWRFVMHGPDGTDYDNRVVYRRIERPRLLVTAHVDESGRDVFETRAEFFDEDGRTRLEFLGVFPTPEARDYVVRHHGAIEGGTQNLARLANFLELATEAARSDVEIVNRRTIDAPVAAVFGAFSDPVQLASWWGPDGFTSTFHEFDFRSGGRWRYTMHGPDGTDYRNESDVVDVVKDARILLHHLQPMHRFHLAITFERRGMSTDVTWRMTFESAAEVARRRLFLQTANDQNLERLARQVIGV